ncbi:DMT family transporter [Actinoallomurus sp. NPDC052308]|uniref:DMT family transporter n=1 Tax=Actinoallomurus sp. NPDC052308 TaxID=3155530 RepID=UPI00342FD287
MSKTESPRLVGVVQLLVAMITTNLSNVLLKVLSGKRFAPLMSAGLVTAIGGALMILPFKVGYDRSAGRKLGAFSVRWTGFRWRELREHGWKILLFTAVSFFLNLFYGEGVVNCSLTVFVALETAGLLLTPALISVFAPLARRLCEPLLSALFKDRSPRGFEEPFFTKKSIKAFLKSFKAFIWPGVTLGGVLLLTLPGEGAHTNLLGFIFAFLTGAGMAVRLMMTKKLPDGTGNLVRGWSGFFAGLGLMAFSPLVETSNPVLSGWLVLVVLAAALTNTTIPSVMEVSATRNLKNAATVAVILAATPVVALVIACLQNLQWPSKFEWIAIPLVVLGAVGAARSDRAEQEALTAPTQGDALAETQGDALADEPADNADASTGTSSNTKRPKPQRKSRSSKKAPSWKKHAGRRKAGRRRPRPKKKH